jgi:YidC/Oxa1 family membrane protein insertase
METRRLFLALAAALAVALLYSTVYRMLAPPPPPPTTRPAMTQPIAPTTPATAASGPAPAAVTTGPSATQTAPATGFSFTAGPDVKRLTLGGQEGDPLEVELTSRGAAIDTIKLTAQDEDGEYVHRRRIETNEPYAVIQPVARPKGPFFSYLTRKIHVGKQAWPLDDLVWDVKEADQRHVIFATTLRSAEDGTERLRIEKVFELPAESATMQLRLRVENLSADPFDLRLEQNGPVGVTKEHLQYDMRKLVVAQWAGEKVDPKAHQRKDLAK